MPLLTSATTDTPPTRPAGTSGRALRREMLPLSAKTPQFLAGPGQPVIIDFGIALLDSAHRAHGGMPAYMAPEQGRGGRIGPRTDLFSLGVIGLELFGIKASLGRRYWLHDEGITSALRAAGVNQPCIDLLHSLVAPLQWLRPASAGEVSQTIVDATRARGRANI